MAPNQKCSSPSLKTISIPACFEARTPARALDHDGVVRQLTRVGVATVRNDSAYDGQSPLKLNANWKRENLRAVVFVQDPKTRRVFAAAAIPF